MQNQINQHKFVGSIVFNFATLSLAVLLTSAGFFAGTSIRHTTGSASPPSRRARHARQNGSWRWRD